MAQVANTKRVTLPQQTLLATLPQTADGPNGTPIHGNTYSTLKAAGMTWHAYYALREQGFIVEVPSGGNEPDVSITPSGIGAQLFNR